MSVPSALVQNHLAITCGQVLLEADGHDYFPAGDEPRFRRAPKVDTPNCAGRAEGPIYQRGNVRWAATITRVRSFWDFTYPVTDGSITAADAVEYSQKWLGRHLTALPDDTTSLQWSTVKTWPTATLEVDGTTDRGFAIVSYSLQMTMAAS